MGIKKLKLSKVTTQNSRPLTKVKLFVYLIALFYMFTLTGCSDGEVIAEEVIEEEIAAIIADDQWFPALWLNSEDYTYQPIYANKTQLSPESIDTNRVYFSSTGLAFTIESNDPIAISYVISKENGELVESKQVETMLVPSDQSHLFDIVASDIVNYNLGETYKLEITTTINGQEAYYYLDLYHSNIDHNFQSVEKVYDYLKKDLKAHEVSFLNVPRFWVHVEDDGTALVRSEFTGATRLDEGFDYIDYIKTFNVDVITGSITQLSQYLTDKQRYYYNSELGGWSLGAQVFISEDPNEFKPYMRKTITTSNQLYQLIYSDYELFIYDLEDEEMSEIYRLDSFNSDYIYDEYQNHKVKVLNINDQGDVYFSVIGYIHDDSEVSQKTGIGFYKYSEGELINLGFFEKDDNISQLENYLTNNTYYNKDLNRLYFFEKQILYMFDLDKNVFSYIDAFLKANFNNESGLISWQGHDNKFNGVVFVVDLKEEDIKVNDISQTGVYKRLLGDSKDYIFVGDYYVEDTYEALNGQITYPFFRINVYDFKGNIVTSYNHSDYGEDIFFGDIYVDDVTGNWQCDLIKRQIKEETNSKNSRINFVVTNGPVVLSELEPINSSQSIEVSEETRLIDEYNDGMIYTENKDQDIIFIPRPGIDSDHVSIIEFEPHPKKDVYKIVDAKGDVLYTTTLIEAIQMAKEKRNYKIYHSQYINRDSTEDELLFDSASLLTSQYLDEVVIIPQRPELPRGCEVVSLNILLEYYEDDVPDKMELADQLKSSKIEYKVIDGFVNYSNMHYEFAGSMSDTSKPGLGVYIEPVKILAENYTDKTPINITGASFEQLLTFVSNEQPVLIIIPNRYQAVPDYGIEVWKTNSGYMEVTYQEHSVVVMGFDENYVYYSDPSKGIIDKKSLQSFKSAWESMGNQGLVILE